MRFAICFLAAVYFAACSVGHSSERYDLGTLAGGEACVDKADGDVCDPGTVSSLRYRNICVGGACVPTRCGDTVVDTAAGEECDDGNGVEHDGCEPDTCKFTCAVDDDCNDGNACNGNETCDLTSRRCLTTLPASYGSMCVVKGATKNYPGMCDSYGNCRFSGCSINGQVDTAAGEECDDYNFIDGDGCDSDCTFSCGSAVKHKASCARPYCNLTGTVAYHTQCTDVLSPTGGNVVIGRTCQTGSGLVCAKYNPGMSPNECTKISCVDGIGCAFVPHWRTQHDGPVDSPAVTSTGMMNKTLQARLPKMKRDTCDSSCDQGSQPALPFASDASTNAQPFCQKIGGISAPDTRCFTSFDYDCDGAVDTVSPVCNPKGRNPGWVLNDETECGKDGIRVEVSGTDLLCERTVSTSVVECK